MRYLLVCAGLCVAMFALICLVHGNWVAAVAWYAVSFTLVLGGALAGE